MPKVIRSSPIVVIFWVICLAAIVIVWRLMPTTASQAALVVLLTLVVASTFLYQTELPILTTVFLSILVIQYWLVTKGHQVFFIALSALLIPAIGIAGDRINRDFRQMEKDQVFSHWLLLGLMTAESITVFNSWPVSFFNRSLLTAIVFYTFWHLLRIQHNVEQRRSYIAHFVFVGVAVIVVVGIIIWANFPHLIN